MKKSLKKLRKDICSFIDNSDIDDIRLTKFKKNAVVALAVGGKGQRLNSITNGDINKNALIINQEGETIVERTIKMYKNAGIKNFVALVYTQADSIKDIIGDGSKYGVKITYSHDPQKQVGRGGAILNALLNNSIPEDKNLIVHNPCDQIIGYPNFVDQCIKGHITGEINNYIATAIVTTSTPYTYTGMKINKGRVEEIEMYPHIPVPAHIGVTIFSPIIYDFFKQLFDLEKKNDFEEVLFPVLSKSGRLFAFGIPHENWIPVKDPKGLDKLQKHLEDSACI